MKNKTKLKQKARKGKELRQVAALPYRITSSGTVEVMLVTSRETSRFVLPKGWRMKGKSDARAAAQEAAEEAGVVGDHAVRPIGSFLYWKRLEDAFVPISVSVYPLLVRQQLDEWPEMATRKRAWLSPSQAAALVDEPELMTLIQAAEALQRAAVPEA